MSGKMNWDREGRRARQARAEERIRPTDIVSAFKTLSFSFVPTTLILAM